MARVVRRGCSLIEVMVAVGIFGMISLVTVSLFSRGRATGARAEEHQVAGMTAARIMQSLVAPGYARLSSFVGEETTLDPAVVGIPAPLAATYRITRIDEFLLEITVTVSVSQTGCRSIKRLALRRLVADPLAGVSVRFRSGGEA